MDTTLKTTETSKDSSSSSKDLLLYIGTYTSPENGSKGVYLYRVNIEKLYYEMIGTSP